jgi:hypothetical protein
MATQANWIHGNALATLLEQEQRTIVARGEKQILEKAKEIRAGRAEARRPQAQPC